jgi:dihydroxyacetone kinase
MVEILGDSVIKNEVYFCELDSVAGDGDFGMSIAKGFRELKAGWDELNKDSINSFLRDCGMVISEHCGGASGPIWGSAFRAGARYAKGKESLSIQELGEMLDAAVKGIQKRGNAQRGDKTLLDALIPTAEALMAFEGDDLKAGLQAGAQAAVQGAEETKTMVASRGRASYVGERSLGAPDAGAMALGILFTDIANTF